MSGKRKQKNNFETTDSVRKAGQKKKVVKRGKFEINLSPRDVTSPILTVTRDYNIMANEVAKKKIATPNFLHNTWITPEILCTGWQRSIFDYEHKRREIVASQE